MGSRSVFFGHHLDNEGEPVAGASVYVYDQHTEDLISPTIYLEDSDHPTLSASTQSNPITTATDGGYAIWLADPAKVDIKIVTPGGLLQDVERTIVVNRTPNDSRVFAETIGDGVATDFTVTHNLSTTDVVVNVYKVSTGAQVEPDITRTSEDVVTIAFTSAPATDEFRVVVAGTVGAGAPFPKVAYHWQQNPGIVLANDGRTFEFNPDAANSYDEIGGFWHGNGFDFGDADGGIYQYTLSVEVPNGATGWLRFLPYGLMQARENAVRFQASNQTGGTHAAISGTVIAKAAQDGIGYFTITNSSATDAFTVSGAVELTVVKLRGPDGFGDFPW